MLQPERRDVAVVLGMWRKVIDPLRQMFASLQMACNVRIAFEPGAIEREVDHGPQRERRGQRMVLFQGFGRQRKLPIVIAVQLAVAGKDHF